MRGVGRVLSGLPRSPAQHLLPRRLRHPGPDRGVRGGAVVRRPRHRRAATTTPTCTLDLLPISTDFLLLPQETSLEVCSPDSAIVTIDVPQFSGFSEPVTLTTGALPPGLAAGFVPNPVTPPSSSVLTLSGTGGVAAGSYDILVIGTSSPSGFVHDANITLGVFTASPGPTSLLTPVNFALNQPLRPTFTWSAATQAATYPLEVDDDPAFGSPALAGAGITEHHLHSEQRPHVQHHLLLAGHPGQRLRHRTRLSGLLLHHRCAARRLRHRHDPAGRLHRGLRVGRRGLDAQRHRRHLGPVRRPRPLRRLVLPRRTALARPPTSASTRRRSCSRPRSR